MHSIENIYDCEGQQLTFQMALRNGEHTLLKMIAKASKIPVVKTRQLNLENKVSTGSSL